MESLVHKVTKALIEDDLNEAPNIKGKILGPQTDRVVCERFEAQLVNG